MCKLLQNTEIFHEELASNQYGLYLIIERIQFGKIWVGAAWIMPGDFQTHHTATAALTLQAKYQHCTS